MSIFNKHKPFVFLNHRLLSALRRDVPFAETLDPSVIVGSPRAYGIDISHWEESFNPDQAASGLIDFAIFKATEGTSWIDPDFAGFYAAAAGKVPVLGAYHYLRSGMSGRTQADHFRNVVGSKDIDILVCDFESANNIMDDAFVDVAREFGQFVKAWYPGVKLLLYTNPSLYDSVIFPGCMRLYGLDVFTQAPWDGFWVAQYYFSPSPSKSPTMPDNRKDWVLWQYSEAGEPAMHGTGGWCDQNVFNGDLADFTAWVAGGENPPPPGDVTESWFDDKVIYRRGHRDSPRPFNFHVTRFKRSDVERLHVNGLGFQGTGLYFWQTRGEPDIVINGGHADYGLYPPVPFSPVVTDGHVQKTKIDEVSIQFDLNHQPIGMVWGIDPEAYNVVGISDVLLQAGVIPASIRLAAVFERISSFLPFVDNTYVDPRNALFWNDTEYILVDIDGRNDGTQGLTRLELAQFAQSIGAKWGGNLDGGDSNTLIFNDAGTPVIKNNPPDGRLHAVANHVGFWIKRGATTPPDGGNMPIETYVTNRNSAQLYNSNGNAREIIPDAGTVIECDWLWPDGPLAGMRKVVSGYPTDGDRFIKDAHIDPYTVPTDPPPVDPPPPPPPPEPGDKTYTVTVTVEEDGYASDTQTISGTLTKL